VLNAPGGPAGDTAASGDWLRPRDDQQAYVISSRPPPGIDGTPRAGKGDRTLSPDLGPWPYLGPDDELDLTGSGDRGSSVGGWKSRRTRMRARDHGGGRIRALFSVGSTYQARADAGDRGIRRKLGTGPKTGSWAFQIPQMPPQPGADGAEEARRAGPWGRNQQGTPGGVDAAHSVLPRPEMRGVLTGHLSSRLVIAGETGRVARWEVRARPGPGPSPAPLSAP